MRESAELWKIINQKINIAKLVRGCEWFYCTKTDKTDNFKSHNNVTNNESTYGNTNGKSENEN